MIAVAILVFIFILGLLIFVHEFGHFVMAKRAGMRVEEFGFGFPPRMFGVRRGETIYSINWIPLGGFVKITGEDGGPNEDPKAFVNKKFWPRFSTLLAGVVMNFILGWFLLFLGFAAIGTPADVTDPSLLGNAKIRDRQLTIVAVEKNSPAEYAGFKHGDQIVSINGQTFSSIPEMIEYTTARAGQNVVYEIKRGDAIHKLDITPRENPPVGSGPVGFAPAYIGKVTYPVPEAFSLSVASFWQKATGILRAFGTLISQLFTSGTLIEGLSGPVGIAVLTRDFTRLGFAYLVQFAAILSINLGVINAFPFPALDGGRVLFLVIEKIRRRRSMKIEQIANTVGFVLLILLMVAITYSDIGKYSEPFKRLFEGIL